MIEIPSLFLVLWSMLRFGRKVTVALCFAVALVSGTVSVVFLLVPGKCISIFVLTFVFIFIAKFVAVDVEVVDAVAAAVLAVAAVVDIPCNAN